MGFKVHRTPPSSRGAACWAKGRGAGQASLPQGRAINPGQNIKAEAHPRDCSTGLMVMGRQGTRKHLEGVACLRALGLSN